MPPVKLKGVGDGFWITVDPGAQELVLEEQLTLLFQRLRHLAINARVTIDMGGADRKDLFNRLSAFLKETFNVGVVTLPPEKRSVPVERIRQRDLSKGWNHHKSDVLMLRGRVRSGQKIETRRHIVVMGDVNPGAEIVSAGNIIIMGRLRGQVHAGRPENEEAFVLALEFRPTHVQIGGTVATGQDESSHGVAEIARVETGRIIVDPYLEAGPFKDLPWPEVI